MEGRRGEERGTWTKTAKAGHSASRYTYEGCCAGCVLSHEDDSLEQKEWRTLVVHNAGFENRHDLGLDEVPS